MSAKVQRSFAESEGCLDDLKDAFKSIFNEPKKSLEPMAQSPSKKPRPVVSKKINIFKPRSTAK